MQSRPSLLDWLLLITLVVTWGSSFTAIKIAILDIGPAWLAALRLSIATALMVVFARATGIRAPRTGHEWAISLVLGVAGTALPFALIGWASYHVPSGIAGLMMATNPMLVLVLAIVVLPDEPPTIQRILGLIIGFAGVALVVTGRTGTTQAVHDTGLDLSLLAYGALLLGALGYAINNVVSRRATHMPHATRGYGALLTATPAAIILAQISEPFPALSALSGNTIAAIAYLAILPTWLATLLLYRLIAHTSAGFVAQSNYMVPATAILLGALFLGETLSPAQYAGFALIMLGIAIAENMLRNPARSGNP